MNAPTRYVDDSTKGFITWSIIWGTVAVLVGILISLQLAWPQLNVGPVPDLWPPAPDPH